MPLRPAQLRTALFALPLLLPVAAPAQVGHDPARSPYRTLRYGQFLGVSTGLFRGTGGQLGVAPHHGPSVGLRYDLLANGTLTVGFAASYASLERFVVDPRKPIATAVTGPVKQWAALTETILQFNLTGGKTWNRIAPFVSGGLGFVLAGKTPEDSSGFKFRTRFALTPGLGARIFLSEKLFLRIEGRAMFWSITYPTSFRTAPSTDPTQPPVLPTPRKEWVRNGWYSVGLSYAFARPF